MKLKDDNGVMSNTQLLDVRMKLNKELAPIDVRTIVVNEDVEFEGLWHADSMAHVPKSKLFGFVIKKSPNVEPNEYEVWINGVLYAV
jgi:hypothetical protein